jgi:magnesium transporter
MNKKKKSNSVKYGLPPGTIVHVGEQKTEEVKILFIRYNTRQYSITEVKSVKDIRIQKGKINWIHITGLHDIELLDKIMKLFKIPSLVMEDIINMNQRPKIEIIEGILLAVIKNIHLHKAGSEIQPSQISLILKKELVISFFEQPMSIFNPVLGRIRNKTGHVRLRREDYLFYILLDLVVDNYFFILEELEDIIEDIDDEITRYPTRDLGPRMQKTRKLIILLRKYFLPFRETIFGFLRKGSPLVKKGTLPFFSDLKDHQIRVVEILETMNDLLMNIIDIYFSNINLRMNEVIRILTIISTIFIPLTFVAGIYGMNFKHFPELTWKYGYFMVWIINLLIIIGMFVFFKKKKWF